MSDPAEDDLAEFVIADDRAAIVSLLHELQRAVLKHPEASAALFSSLVAEGRAFAQTREGARIKQAVLGSALLERALLVWESASLFIPQGQDGVAPSSLIDAVARTAMSTDRDALVEQLFTTLEED